MRRQWPHSPMKVVERPKTRQSSSSLTSTRSNWLLCHELFRERKSLFPPNTNAAMHREHVLVPHFLQVVGSKCGAVASAAIENKRSTEVGHFLFDIALNDSLAKMNCPRQM